MAKRPKFEVGDRVRDPMHGPGTVTHVMDEHAYVTVRYDADRLERTAVHRLERIADQPDAEPRPERADDV